MMTSDPPAAMTDLPTWVDTMGNGPGSEVNAPSDPRAILSRLMVNQPYYMDMSDVGRIIMSVKKSNNYYVARIVKSVPSLPTE